MWLVKPGVSRPRPRVSFGCSHITVDDISDVTEDLMFFLPPSIHHSTGSGPGCAGLILLTTHWDWSSERRAAERSIGQTTTAWNWPSCMSGRRRGTRHNVGFFNYLHIFATNILWANDQVHISWDFSIPIALSSVYLKTIRTGPPVTAVIRWGPETPGCVRPPLLMSTSRTSSPTWWPVLLQCSSGTYLLLIVLIFPAAFCLTSSTVFLLLSTTISWLVSPESYTWKLKLNMKSSLLAINVSYEGFSTEKLYLWNILNTRSIIIVASPHREHIWL